MSPMVHIEYIDNLFINESIRLINVDATISCRVLVIFTLEIVI